MKEATIGANSGNVDEERNSNELPFILDERNNRKVHCEGQIVVARRNKTSKYSNHEAGTRRGLRAVDLAVKANALQGKRRRTPDFQHVPEGGGALSSSSTSVKMVVGAAHGSRALSIANRVS